MANNAKHNKNIRHRNAASIKQRPEPEKTARQSKFQIIRHLNVANVSVAVFVIFAYFMLPMRNGYMLRWYDEMSLFEPTRFFFHEFINYPGGILRYAGAWLTQFMYYPALGSAILIALWLLMAWLSCKTFHLGNKAVPFSLMIPLAMLVSILQLDEAWLTLKTPGYIYSNTLGFLFAILMVWLFRISEKKKILSLILPALISQTYFLAGFYGLAASAICLIILLVKAIQEKDYRDYVAIALTILLIVKTPSLYFTYWHGNLVDNDYLLLKGLPELLFESFDIYLWLPFVVAANWLIVLGIIGAVKPDYESRLTPWVSIIFFVLSLAWCVRADHKNEQLRASVLMLKFVDQHNWRAINNIMSNLHEEPNYTMLVINNLANANQGKSTIKLPVFSPKPADGRHNENFTMSVFVKVPIYYYIGKNSESYRWAMEHTISYGKRVFFLKYMVKNALVNGEIQLAKRYNDILLRTMFHRKWAEEMNRFIENPTLIATDEEFNAVKSFLD